MAEDRPIGPRTSLRRASNWVGGALLLLSLFYVGLRLFQLDWSSVVPILSWRFGAAVSAGIVLFAAADHALARGWSKLADPEEKFSSARLAKIYGRSVMLKYLPGSVFQYVGRHAEARHLGLSHGLLSRSHLMEIALHIIASISVVAALLVLGDAPDVAATASVVVAAACLIIHRPLTTALMLQLIAFAGFGLAAMIIGWVVLPDGTEQARFAAIFLIAWLIGFLVPLAPGGLGVREAALLALAGTSYPAAGIMAALLALRIASIAGDAFYGIGTLCLGRFKNP